MTLSSRVEKFNDSSYANPWEVSSLARKRIARILQYSGSGKRVLDIGCYDGTIAKLLENQNNTVVGIDISAKAVTMAKKKGIKAFKFNIENEKVPASLGKFDLVIATEIIEHIFDTDQFIEKIKKSLKKNGQLLITTPNIAGLGSRLSLLMGQLPWMIENDLGPGKSGHIRYYTFDALKETLARHGFEVERFATDSVGIGDRMCVPFLDNFVPTLGRILVVLARKV